ncbi:hypothetical protein BC826DRAFT_1052981 [Russula brevipes]|nr:hypothetical protein BC826DRAFT_1052981 [Russula brevipes]
MASLLILCALHALGLPHTRAGHVPPSVLPFFPVAVTMSPFVYYVTHAHCTSLSTSRRTTHSPLHAFSTFAWPPTSHNGHTLSAFYIKKRIGVCLYNIQDGMYQVS